MNTFGDEITQRIPVLGHLDSLRHVLRVTFDVNRDSLVPADVLDDIFKRIQNHLTIYFWVHGVFISFALHFVQALTLVRDFP